MCLLVAEKSKVGKWGTCWVLRVLICFFATSSLSWSQTASELFPDVTKCKLELPVDLQGKDYTGVRYMDRESPFIKAATIAKLNHYEVTDPFDQYFFVAGKEMVFRAHAAGALTSPNAYPRCELRQQIDGKDTFWKYQEEHQLKVTFRVMELPKEKQEVCVVQLKGTNTPSSTKGTSEVLRLEYRQDGDSGWHLEVNESAGPKNVLKYSLGQTISVSIGVKNHVVRLEMENVDTNENYTFQYKSKYTHGYFKAGAYTQSSIWTEKSGAQHSEKPKAYSEVRFSKFSID